MPLPGASVERMAARLAHADSADRVPITPVALYEGEPIGAVNLVENDDEGYTVWTRWLAGMVIGHGSPSRPSGATALSDVGRSGTFTWVCPHPMLIRA